MVDPLRLDIASDADAVSKDRFMTMSGMMHCTNAVGDTYEHKPDACLATIKHSAEKGWLADMPTWLLGLRQSTRYSPEGTDQAKLMVEEIAGSVASAPDGTQLRGMCSFKDPSMCNTTPITKRESQSVIAATIPVTPEMNQERVIRIDTSLAFMNGNILGFMRPSVTGSVDIVGSAARARLKTPDSVNKQIAEKCLKIDPSVDVKVCQQAGIRNSIYLQADTGLRYSDPAPMQLTRQPTLIVSANQR